MVNLSLLRAYVISKLVPLLNSSRDKDESKIHLIAKDPLLENPNKDYPLQTDSYLQGDIEYIAFVHRILLFHLKTGKHSNEHLKDGHQAELSTADLRI